MSPQRDAHQQEASDQQLRQAIVEAADALYYAHGFRAVGMAALRQRTGLSLKRLYTLFPSKESIVLAVLDYRHQMLSRDIADAVGAVSMPRERLLAIYDYLAGWFRSESFRGCVFVNAFGELAPESPAVAVKAAEYKLEFRRYMEELAAEAGYSEQLGDQLMLLAEGAQTTAAITGDSSMALKARSAADALMSVEDSPRERASA